MRYSKYFILDILLYFALYTGYINKIQQHVLPYNISHISHISKSSKNPNSGIRAIVLSADRMEGNMSHVVRPAKFK